MCFCPVVASFLLFVVGCVRSTNIGKGFTASHHHQPWQTGVVTLSQYCQQKCRDAQTRSRFKTNTVCPNMNNNNSNNNNGTIRTSNALPNNGQVVISSENHRLPSVWKKEEQRQWLHGGLHRSTTTTVHYHHWHHPCSGMSFFLLGPLLIVAPVIDGWLLLLSPTVDCCIWIWFFFHVDCYFFLSCRPVNGTLTPLPMLLPLPSPSPPHRHRIALCCVVLCGEVFQCAASAPDSVTASTIPIAALAVVSTRTQNSSRPNSIGTFHKAMFSPCHS